MGFFSFVFFFIKGRYYILGCLRIWKKCFEYNCNVIILSAIALEHKDRYSLSFCWKLQVSKSIISFPEALAHDLHNAMVSRTRHREDCQIFGYWYASVCHPSLLSHFVEENPRKETITFSS